jgi:hypothetical protein
LQNVFYVYIHYCYRGVYIKARNFILAQGPQNLRTGAATKKTDLVEER